MWDGLPTAASAIGSVLVLFLAGALGIILVIFVVRWLLAAFVNR